MPYRLGRAVVLAALCALGGCASTTRYLYSPTTLETLREGPTCDRVCDRQVSFCGLVERCDESSAPDQCELAAIDVPDGSVLIECAYEDWTVAGPP